ncbi:MAG TPA: DegT/DnrJ/EryC1/StrS family aminotransferase, partial [Desulfobacteraceae bacterium]|nr:DegT/DnrJ/EryC1/StrS family aminotransferase [Desulfobacteraceae bacterium]
MQFIDLAAQQRRIRKDIDEGIARVLDHGRYIMGPEIPELEERLAAYTGSVDAVGCGSGTDALLMALMAAGVGPGDAVFIPTFTFIATAGVVGLLGAVPVFVDIDPVTFNMTPDSLDRAVRACRKNDSSIHPLPRLSAQPLRPKAVIPVDLFGILADYQGLEHIACSHDLFLIEDAAQSFGGELGGRKAGSFGMIACTSFFPAKPLACYGDGGMCFTDDRELAEILRSIRVHGQGIDKYRNVRIGINGRLDSMQAAVLLCKFKIFQAEMEMRQHVASRYAAMLDVLPDLTAPTVPESCVSAWAQYSILARDKQQREAILAGLQGAGIPSAVYYPIPLHLQEAFSSLGYKAGDFPVSEDCAGRIFSIPMHPYLEAPDQERIIEAVG